jgi:hypothetical protein
VWALCQEKAARLLIGWLEASIASGSIYFKCCRFNEDSFLIIYRLCLLLFVILELPHHLSHLPTVDSKCPSANAAAIENLGRIHTEFCAFFFDLFDTYQLGPGSSHRCHSTWYWLSMYDAYLTSVEGNAHENLREQGVHL